MTRPEFSPFPKIPRLRRTIVVTEKIDGTNAQVLVTPEGDVYAGSRNRWITPESDNYGFARWVEDNKAIIAGALGVGQHFGEWWGPGIQHGYTSNDGQGPFFTTRKQFSLFNTHRWGKTLPVAGGLLNVVPELYIGQYSDTAIQDCLDDLRTNGSKVAPGFMKPEGVVVYMQSSGTMHKVLLEGDELPKGFLVKAERERLADPNSGAFHAS